MTEQLGRGLALAAWLGVAGCTRTVPPLERPGLPPESTPAVAARAEPVPETSASPPRPTSGPAPRSQSAGADAAASYEGAVPREPLRLRFVGDVIFGRYKDGRHRRLAGDGDAVFLAMAPLLDGDWVVANLETPLAASLPPWDKRPGYFFGATKAMAEPLRTADFDAVTLANNHAADLGVEGLRETPRLLEELGVTAFGAASYPSAPRVETTQRDGVRIGVVAVTTQQNFALAEGTPGVPLVPTHELGDAVGPLLAAARQSHELLVVLVHWGVEYARFPEKVQRLAAHALVEQGADLVIGHHPHVLQEIELHAGGVIAYSLGNFLFENTSPEPRLTGVLAVDVERPGLCELEVRFHPAVMRHAPFFHPVPATEGRARRARERVLPRERARAGQFVLDGEALVARTRRRHCESTE